MRSRKFYKGLFAIAAAYNLVLGAVFFLFYGTIYAALSIQMPESISYIHLAPAVVYRNLELPVHRVPSTQGTVL